MKPATDGQLTPRQRELLEAMRQRGNGADATLTDLARDLGCSRPNLYRPLRALQKKGLVRKDRWDGEYAGRWVVG